jgi:hypothetical protein
MVATQTSNPELVLLHRNGGLTKRLRQSEMKMVVLTGHCKSETMAMIMPLLKWKEESEMYGINTSLTRMVISAMSKRRDVYMSKTTKTSKPILQSSGEDMVVLTRNGISSMLMKLRQFKIRVSTKSSECTAADHSISDQDSQ